MQLYSGRESLIPYEVEMDVAGVIHPETDIRGAGEYQEGVEL